MSNIDFQNGFVVGLSSNANQDIIQALEAFKNKEIAWEKKYLYNTAEMEGKYAFGSNPMFELTLNKIPGASADYSYWAISIRYRLAIARRVKRNGVPVTEYLVETPLEAEFKEGANGYLSSKITNIDNVYDIGINIDEEPVSLKEYFLTEIIADGEYFYEGNVEFNSYDASQNDGSGFVGLEVIIRLETKDETIADTFFPELEAMLTAYKDTFIIHYKNTPEVETVNAKYLGG
jgi:hypothetical protein